MNEGREDTVTCEWPANFTESGLSEASAFLHEHPRRAGSWNEECVRTLSDADGVVMVKGTDVSMEDVDSRQS